MLETRHEKWFKSFSIFQISQQQSWKISLYYKFQTSSPSYLQSIIIKIRSKIHESSIATKFRSFSNSMIDQNVQQYQSHLFIARQNRR